jgi:DUF1365 family protein
MTGTFTAPALYDATVVHNRFARMRRSFSHSVYMWLLDVDALPRLPWYLRPLAGFLAKDHLGSPERSISDNVRSWLSRNGIELNGGRILMLANARTLGYVFNPITVYWCYTSDGELACILAEVHNTYQERHCYLLRPDAAGRAEVGKKFYVSPFLPMGGHYVMRFSEPGAELSVTIALRQNGKTPFSAGLRGRKLRLTRANVLRLALRRPLMSQCVAALIRRHGIALWLRRVPVIRRPKHIPQKGVG